MTSVSEKPDNASKIRIVRYSSNFVAQRTGQFYVVRETGGARCEYLWKDGKWRNYCDDGIASDAANGWYPTRKAARAAIASAKGEA